MKIAVFGATGMSGSAIVTEALSRGHEIIAASRKPAPAHFRKAQRLSQQVVDVGDLGSVDAVLSAVDTAVLAIRLALGEEYRLAALTKGFLDAAERQGVRVLVVGGAAPLRSPNDQKMLLIDDPEYVPNAWKDAARASLDQFHICVNHRYAEWVYLSPAAILEPGERTGTYRRGTTKLLVDETGQSRITAPDLAIAVIDELVTPSGNRHFTIARS